MKVLELPEKFEKIVICKREVDKYGHGWGKKENFCGAKLEITENDICYRKWEKFCDSGVDYGVKCPVCGSFIVVENLSDYIKKKAVPFSLFVDKNGKS